VSATPAQPSGDRVRGARLPGDRLSSAWPSPRKPSARGRGVAASHVRRR
jgi:hypothetical protein